MLPGNPTPQLSDPTFRGSFLVPNNLSTTPLSDYERGGVALQDISQGHDTQNWFGYWNPTTSKAYLRALTTAPATDIEIFSEAGVENFSFALDQNMRWVAVTRTTSDQITRMRWYDPTLPGYTTTPYTGISSFKLTLDDVRFNQLLLGAADVIFTYTKVGGGLFARVQRDRYLVEYTLDPALPNTWFMTHAGMNSLSRFQWRFATRAPT